VVNNLNATFYAFVNDNRRGEHDIENLWRVFKAEIDLSAIDNEENRKTFIEAFNSTVVQFGLGWKLTMGLYWVRPFDFDCVEKLV
jgi:5-methylcytosine-specific restriction protein B